eukprot:scaffold15562_cov48-Phaeocystis_antarctica.AAC.2
MDEEGTAIADSPASHGMAARLPSTPGSAGGGLRGKQALNAKTDRALTAFGDGRAFIGLLDMFGFEIFEHNGLEQARYLLCINFANEKLQQYFVRCVFKAEEEIHRLEGVPWPEDVAYHDNQGCIDALTQPRSGVFRLLDESCALRSAAEAEWFRIVDQALCVGTKAGAESYLTNAGRYKLRDDEAFVVRHFAGDVCYISAAAQARTNPKSSPSPYPPNPNPNPNPNLTRTRTRRAPSARPRPAWRVNARCGRRRHTARLRATAGSTRTVTSCCPPSPWPWPPRSHRCSPPSSSARACSP